MDYYETLGVSKSASVDDIKKAYRKLASRHHPDKGGDTKKFQEIQVAYDTLSDPNKKSAYDNRGRGPKMNFGPGDFSFNGTVDEDVMDMLRNQFGFHFSTNQDGPFGRTGSRGFHQQPRKNKDMRISISVPLKSTLEEQSKTISFRTTKGNNEIVEIKLPRGVENNSTIKYTGLGDNFFDSLPRGDLFINVVVLPDEKFIVTNEIDLLADLVLSVYDVILGTQVEVEGLDGRTFSLNIPAGTQPNTKFRIKNEGLYSNRHNAKGHLYVEIHVEVPKDLTEQQKELVKQLKG